MLCNFCCTLLQPFGIFEAHQFLLQVVLMESSLLRRGVGSNSSSITQMRACASVGLGGATDGHPRAAAPLPPPPAGPAVAAASQGICKTEYPVLY